MDENWQIGEPTAEKRPRGRPKGSKDKVPRNKPHNMVVDPKTGVVVSNKGLNAVVINHIGDERVSMFVQYHMDLLRMGQNVDKSNVQGLYQKFTEYLGYCAEKGIIPNNMSGYLALGVSRQDINGWKLGKGGTPDHKKFAEDVTRFFASVHEQGAAEGVFNPILGIFWQKAHDGMIEAQKLEVSHDDPLGDKRSGEDIMKKYEGVDLPE